MKSFRRRNVLFAKALLEVSLSGVVFLPILTCQPRFCFQQFVLPLSKIGILHRLGSPRLLRLRRGRARGPDFTKPTIEPCSIRTSNGQTHDQLMSVCRPRDQVTLKESGAVVGDLSRDEFSRSEERRVGKECR